MGRPKILLSLDSSWWNRFRFNRLTYGTMLRRAGCRARPIRYAELVEADVLKADLIESLLDETDGLLLSGGGDVPHPPSDEEDDPLLYRGVKPLRDQFEATLLEKALERSMPVLGVCRGAQLLNIRHGGRNHSLRPDRGRFRYHRIGRHPVSLVKGSRLWDLVPEAEGRFQVSSYHAHAVKRCGEGLRPAAFAQDGVVEAIEAENWSHGFKMGVQWHPEWMPRSLYQRKIIAAFCNAARGETPAS